GGVVPPWCGFSGGGCVVRFAARFGSCSAVAGRRSGVVSDVRVNPPSVRAYGQSAQEMFGSIRTSLEALVADAVSVDYYGPNAVSFKTKCGELASELANALTLDMTKIADAVRSTTSNIAASLGGGPVDIQFNGATIE